MRALTASEIISLWETAHRFHPVDQSLSILQQVMPDYTRDQLAAMPLGKRDTLLLSLRRITFGDTLPGRCNCQHCGEAVEFELSCTELTKDAVEPQLKVLCLDDYNITIRPLNSFDLAAAAGTSSLEDACELLLHCCVAESRFRGKAVESKTLPPVIVDRIIKTAPTVDPQAEVKLDLNCPVCQHQWHSLFDISRFLWLEISARARQLLMAVHRLARAYGWTEAEILNLSPVRRAVYLQMVAA